MYILIKKNYFFLILFTKKEKENENVFRALDEHENKSEISYHSTI